MTDKELRKLKRVELLELLVDQATEMELLQEKLAAAEKKLEDRRILKDEAGSMADAALHLNEVFQTADRAAQDYVASAKAQAEAILARAEEESAAMLEKARAECEALIRPIEGSE